MLKKLLFVACVPLLTVACSGSQSSETTSADSAAVAATMIELTVKEAENSVAVTVNGKPFTHYIYPSDVEKPVLYPIFAPNGEAVTRGFPRDPRPGERVDHPHHVGHWFNYGDVNGLDFWNNSYDIPADKKDKYGTIRHQQILKAESGEQGILEVETAWLAPNTTKLLAEKTTFVFAVEDSVWTIERITTLTAQEQPVLFTDNKEGMLAIRVARELEMPAEKPEIFTDASGKPTAVPTLNNEGVTGNYLNSEGITGGDVWGKQAVWCKLFGQINGVEVSIGIIDHPQNPGYPTYWHARGYGLFAANTLGQKVFSNGEKEMNFELAAGESITFRYKMVFKSGAPLTPEALNQMAESFAKRL